MPDTEDHNIENNEAATADALRRRLVAAYFSNIARRKLWSLWWMALVALAVIVLGFAVDLRVAIVGFMLLLIVYPLSMTLTVLSSAFSPEVIKLTGVTTAVLSDDSLSLFDVSGAEIALLPLDSVRSVSESAGLVRITDCHRRLVIVPRDMLDADAIATLYRAVPDELS